MKKTKKGKGKGSHKRKRDKFEETDDWCFVCKDGGDLVICDHEDCLKVYHPECVGKDVNLLQNGKSWTCDRHSCFICSKATKIYCFCCPNAICGSCDSAAEFVPCCRNGGLCYECFKLILLAEENADCDSDGEKLDFNDRETYECLLKEYWDIIKEKEGLTMDHVYSADSFFKKRKLLKRRSSSVENDAVEEEYQLISDSDEDSLPKKKGNKAKESGTSGFQGSVSKVLTQFLNSIGEDPRSKQLSLLEVHSMICKYINKENLLHPEKKNRFVCDERLFAIFRRKAVHRNRIYKLLQPHFIDTTELSDDSESDGACEAKTVDKSKGSGIRPCLQTKLAASKTKKPIEAVVAPKVRETGYASIDVSNMKLIYLRKSLVEELAKQRDSFEGKMMGSLIKVKVDPLDILQMRQYQLFQVTGVKTLADDDVSSQILLHVSGRLTDISILALSDADIYEEDCEDLRERVKAGLFKKLTVVDVKEKAKVLHEERTEHWIKKELIRLEYLVERANVKGWRRELYQYLEQRTLLRKPSEVERLLKQEAKVTSETVVETSSNSEIDDEWISASPPVILVDS